MDISCVLPGRGRGRGYEEEPQCDRFHARYSRARLDSVRVPAGRALDEAYSDPSISFFWIHVEPSLTTQLTRRSRAWVGVRYGLAHERVGDRDEGLWAWGWLGGVAGGLSYAVNGNIGIGLHVAVMRLDLHHPETGVAAPGGIDREGWLISVGPEITIGGAD